MYNWKLMTTITCIIYYYTLWPNKNASILFGITCQKLIDKKEKLFHNSNK